MTAAQPIRPSKRMKTEARSSSAGIASPLWNAPSVMMPRRAISVYWDVPYLDIHDADGLARETAAAKVLGYVAKLAIHPAQISTINAAFLPSSTVLDRAQRVVAAFEQAHGAACQVDGKMVDAPVVKAARRTVMLASRAA